MRDIYDTGEVEISRTDLWSQGILLEEFQSYVWLLEGLKIWNARSAFLDWIGYSLSSDFGFLKKRLRIEIPFLHATALTRQNFSPEQCYC